MSKSQRGLVIPEVKEIKATEHAMLVLERQLVDTRKLERLVRQLSLRQVEVTAVSLLSLLESELQTFARRIEARLVCRRPVVCSDPIPTDTSDPRELFRGLLSAFAYYEKGTTDAIACLEWSGDFESAELLRTISPAIERCLGVLDIYLEELAALRYSPSLTGTSKWTVFTTPLRWNWTHTR